MCHQIFGSHEVKVAHIPVQYVLLWFFESFQCCDSRLTKSMFRLFSSLAEFTISKFRSSSPCSSPTTSCLINRFINVRIKLHSCSWRTWTKGSSRCRRVMKTHDRGENRLHVLKETQFNHCAGILQLGADSFVFFICHQLSLCACFSGNFWQS